MSVDLAQGLFNCHHAGCNFRGNALRLARELGLTRQLNRAEYRELCENRELADRAAQVVFECVQTQRFDLLQRLRALGRAELAATEAGGDRPTTWDSLAQIYRERPHILTELTVLENSTAGSLIRFLTAGPERRAQMVNAVLMAGGVCGSRARFVEISL